MAVKVPVLLFCVFPLLNVSVFLQDERERDKTRSLVESTKEAEQVQAARAAAARAAAALAAFDGEAFGGGFGALCGIQEENEEEGDEDGALPGRSEDRSEDRSGSSHSRSRSRSVENSGHYSTPPKRQLSGSAEVGAWEAAAHEVTADTHDSMVIKVPSSAQAGDTLELKVETPLSLPPQLPVDPAQLAIRDGRPKLSFFTPSRVQQVSGHIRRVVVPEGTKAGDKIEVKVPKPRPPPPSGPPPKKDQAIVATSLNPFAPPTSPPVRPDDRTLDLRSLSRSSVDRPSAAALSLLDAPLAGESEPTE